MSKKIDHQFINKMLVAEVALKLETPSKLSKDKCYEQIAEEISKNFRIIKR